MTPAELALAGAGAPESESFLRDVLRGLSQRPKRIPSKHFYDARGSALFDAICELPEYYLTRTERGILEAHAGDMAERLGPGCLVVEYGSGSSVKTPLLLERLREPAGYVPVDVSRETLRTAAAAIAARFPRLHVAPLWADFTAPFAIPSPHPLPRRTVIFFPGSTIGNFVPREALALLRQMAAQAGEGGALLVGVDLRKDRGTLERAYDDARGVTAAFNLNLLARANRDLGADFRLSAFRHVALWAPRPGRVEMHLESLEEQVVHVAGLPVRLAAGERILTEYSYKWRPRDFAALAARAGWRVERVWTDADRRFSLQLLAHA